MASPHLGDRDANNTIQAPLSSKQNLRILGGQARNMNKTESLAPVPSVFRMLLRNAALALLCGLLQALLPRYLLGTDSLAPLSMALGVAVAATLARGGQVLPAALLGITLGELSIQTPLAPALLEAVVLGLQVMTVLALMRRDADPAWLQFDTWHRLRRFALLAAPAAALVGAVAGTLARWGLEAAMAQPLSRPQWSEALGRLIADTGGIVVVAPILLCWLARPQAPWRPRRRQVALPLALLVLAMLPGFHEVARRDDFRLLSSFERDASARRQRLQQLLASPQDAALALAGVASAGSDGPPLAAFERNAAAWMARLAGLQGAGWLDRRSVAGAEAGAWRLHQVQGKAASGGGLPGSTGGPDHQISLPESLKKALDHSLELGTAVLLPMAPSEAAAGAAPAAADRTGAAALSSLVILQAVPAAAGSMGRQVVYLVVDAARLLAPALPDLDDPNLRICITDVGSDPREASRRIAGAPACEQDAAKAPGRRALSRLTVGERRLDLLVTEPPGADSRRFTAVWLLALPAVLGTAMLAALLLALTGRLRRIEDRVRERTLALQTEIDERRQTEAALAVSEQRFRAIFDSVSIGVTVVDPAGKLIEVNPAFCTMMGCPASSLLGRPLADFHLPDVQTEDSTAVAVGGAAARRQRYITPDGRVLQVAANLRTLHDAHGHAVATVGALQDLTQVLRLREAERERDEAAVANRTKSEFLANLSHELRTPLNAIVGFAQMLGQSAAGEDDDGLGNPAQSHGLAQIRQAGWHLLDMVNDVLDLSRMEAGSLRLTLEPVSLADLAQEAATLVEPAALQAGVQVNLSLSPQADRAMADATRLRQVLLNLLGNAIKYNRPGGRVMLRTRPGAVGEVLIEVEDTGIGMSEAQIAELFIPFNRLGRDQPGLGGVPASQGTGIGLVISRKLSEMMGGQLSVTSRALEGSTFSLRLQRPSGEAVRTVVTQSMPLGSKVVIGSVLYIEDNEADIQAMRDLLARRPGITLSCARSAAEGLELAHDIDLVLLDLDLPDRPGMDLLRTLMADSRMRHTPVVVVSAESRPQRIDECFDAGAAQFLTKPLDPQLTLRTIDASLG